MRRNLTCLGLVVASWLLVAGAAEGAFRLLGDQPSLDLKNLYSSFGSGSYKLASNVDTAATWSSGRLTVHTDQLGLRCDGERHLATRPGGSVDVLFLGDSQGFGNGVSFEDSLAGSAALAIAHDGYRAANASVGGHSAATQLQLAEWLRDAQGLKAANYVLLVTPAIAQSGDFLSRAMVGNDGRLYDGVPTLLPTLRMWAKTSLVTYSRVRDAARHGGFTAEPAKDAPFVFGFYAADAAERQQQSFTRFVGRLKEFAASHGARVHLVYVPLTLEMDFEPIRASAAARGLVLDRDVPLRTCTAAARAHGLTVQNLRPLLESLHAKATEPLHLRGDFHYNAEVSRACGHLIWDALRPALPKNQSLVLNHR